MDIQLISLEILVLVNSSEFKNKDFIYEQHDMIKQILEKLNK